MNGPLPPISSSLGVLRGALGDRALHPFESVHRGTGRQPLEQRLVDDGGSARRVEDEDRDPIGTFRPGPQVRTNPSSSPDSRYSRTTVASSSIVFAGADLLGSDGPLGPLGETRGDLGRGVRIDLRQLVEDAARGLPVTIAHVAKVTRSEASRGGTSVPRASTTACWVSARRPRPRRTPHRPDPPGRWGRRNARSRRIGRRRRDVRAGRVGGRRGDMRLRMLLGQLLCQRLRDLPGGQLGLLGGDLLGVMPFWCSASSATWSRFSIA